MIDPSHIAEFPLNIVKSLQRAGYTTYFVGGCVRDLLVGRVPKDFDIATSAKPNEIRKIVQRGRLIGNRFKLVLVRDGGNMYEISTFRSAIKNVDRGGRRNFNIFGKPSEDARRRDFTINGMFYDPATDKVIDYVGGQEDVHRHLLRSISHPAESFSEDPIRILRGLRIAGKLGFDISTDDYYEMVIRRNLLEKVSKDRVREEVFKALKEGTTRTFCQQMIRSGIVEYIFPIISGYDRSKIDDLMGYLNAYDHALPFKDFELAVSVFWLPLAKRLLSDPNIDVSSVAEISKSFELFKYLKDLLRYSGKFTVSIAQVYYFWFQIRKKWIDDGVPETRKRNLYSDPHFYAALQLALIEETVLGDMTPVTQWLKKELEASSKPDSLHKPQPRYKSKSGTESFRRRGRFVKRGGGRRVPARKHDKS